VCTGDFVFVFVSLVYHGGASYVQVSKKTRVDRHSPSIERLPLAGGLTSEALHLLPVNKEVR